MKLVKCSSAGEKGCIELCEHRSPHIMGEIADEECSEWETCNTVDKIVRCVEVK